MGRKARELTADCAVLSAAPRRAMAARPNRAVARRARYGLGRATPSARSSTSPCGSAAFAASAASASDPCATRPPCQARRRRRGYTRPHVFERILSIRCSLAAPSTFGTFARLTGGGRNGSAHADCNRIRNRHRSLAVFFLPYPRRAASRGCPLEAGITRAASAVVRSPRMPISTDDLRIREIKELTPPSHLVREFPVFRTCVAHGVLGSFGDPPHPARRRPATAGRRSDRARSTMSDAAKEYARHGSPSSARSMRRTS